ncbi:hypothetical protein RRG08_062137 [Elysia crispata]|uniref:Uncharacterized protein n=1 Tax=Elysia crispata TaxID=231223 RepID=A0AAE0YN73_9GAST|nr:hypothetical protein RRG08_062137 [Elysia crispata]
MQSYPFQYPYFVNSLWKLNGNGKAGEGQQVLDQCTRPGCACDLREAAGDGLFYPSSIDQRLSGYQLNQRSRPRTIQIQAGVFYHRGLAYV